MTASGPIRSGFVETEDDGTVIRTGPVDFYDGALVPGFVNAHCHVELSYLKGLFRKGTGMAGFIDQINALRDTQSPSQKLRALREAMDSMWAQGVDAMADISNCADSFAVKAVHPLYTRTFLEVFGTEPEDCPAVMASVTALAGKARSFGLDAAPTPHACYTMSPELLREASAAGLRSGFLSYHSEESPEEDEMIRFGRGKMWDNRKAARMSTPPVTGGSSLSYFLDQLEKVVPLPVEGHVLLVHECCMDAAGARAAQAALKHPFVALCPLSNLFIHNALPPVEMMRREGLTLCVGTDSLSSNDELDMVRELYCLQEHFPEVPLEELLEWACRNGARFLGKEDVLGSFAPGSKAGVVLIDHLQDGRLTAESHSRRL